jgi:hypothetical protein
MFLITFIKPTMNLVKIFITSFFLVVCSIANAQKVKPQFKKLTDIIYEIDSTGNTKKIIIKDYFEIDSNGRAHLKSVYYNGIADTTYRLSDTSISRLNKIFNGSKSLKSYMMTNKLPAGDHFYGPLEFVSYTSINNTMDNIIVVTP